MNVSNTSSNLSALKKIILGEVFFIICGFFYYSLVIYLFLSFFLSFFHFFYSFYLLII